jgi:hypothetical protein
MIGESPEWALWVMVGLLAFMILLPIITSVSAHRAIVLPQTRAAARRSAAVMPPRRFRSDLVEHRLQRRHLRVSTRPADVP